MVPFFPLRCSPLILTGLFCRGRSLQPGKHGSSCILPLRARRMRLPRITWVPSSHPIWVGSRAWGSTRSTWSLPWCLCASSWAAGAAVPVPPQPRQSRGLRGAFSQCCLHRLTLACQHVRGVLLASLMLRRPELYRLSLKPCPVGPGIMNIRTLPFYVNTY